MSPHRRFLALEHEVSLILAETSAAAEAYPKLLATVGSSHAGFCFPIRTARGVVGAIEFLTSKLQEPLTLAGEWRGSVEARPKFDPAAGPGREAPQARDRAAEAPGRCGKSTTTSARRTPILSGGCINAEALHMARA